MRLKIKNKNVKDRREKIMYYIQILMQILRVYEIN